MNIELNTSLPDSSRIWIYQASRDLTTLEANDILVEGKQFVSGWNAHGKPLLADFFVLYNRFLILAVDESQEMPSGCSIDKSAHFILKKQQELGISFTDRLSLVFLTENGLTSGRLAAVQKELGEELVSPDQLFFDNTVSTLEQLRNKWVKPIGESWLNKFLPESARFS